MDTNGGLARVRCQPQGRAARTVAESPSGFFSLGDCRPLLHLIVTMSFVRRYACSLTTSARPAADRSSHSRLSALPRAAGGGCQRAQYAVDTAISASRLNARLQALGSERAPSHRSCGSINGLFAACDSLHKPARAPMLGLSSSRQAPTAAPPLNFAPALRFARSMTCMCFGASYMQIGRAGDGYPAAGRRRRWCRQAAAAAPPPCPSSRRCGSTARPARRTSRGSIHSQRRRGGGAGGAGAGGRQR